MSPNDADAYDRFMGRFSRPLAVPFADFAGLPIDGHTAVGVSGEGGLMIHCSKEEMRLSSPSPVRDCSRCADAR